MAFPVVGQTIYGAWTQKSESAADLETRLTQRAFNVMDAPFNAKGDGTTDDTTALQAALNAAANGMLIIPSGKSFKVSAELLISSFTTIFAYGATITQVTADCCVLRGAPNATNVTIFGGKYVGPGQISYTDTSKGVIYFVSPGITRGADIRIRDTEVTNGPNGITAVLVDRLWIENNHIHDLGSSISGLGGLSTGICATKSTAFRIVGNRIKNIHLAAFPANTYGITASGDTAGGATQEQCVINENIIDGAPAWDGIMCHEVSDLVVSGNIFKNVRTGVDIGSGTNVNVIQRVVVTNNVIYGTPTNPWGATQAAAAGIAIVGYDATHRIGVVLIANNTISNIGAEAGAVFTSTSGGIVIGYIDNCSCIGNFIDGILATSVAMNAIQLVGTLNRITVADNTVQGAYGVGLRGASIICDYLNIHGNTFAPTSPATMPGVVISGATITQLMQYGNLDPSTAAAGASHDTVIAGAPVITLTDASPIVLDCTRGNMFEVTLGAGRTLSVPTGPVSGQRIHLTVIQDGTGGRALNMSNFPKLTWSDAGNTLNKRSTIAAIYDGTNWNQDGNQTPYI